MTDLSPPQQRAKDEGKRICKDCVADPNCTTYRPAPHQGPRCKTHWTKYKAKSKGNSHESYVARTYDLAPGEYGKLYESQDGLCAICNRSTGATRRLSVDHDHGCCAGGVSCGYCVRGLLCRPCNDFLGYVRDDWKAFARGVRYLTGPPAAERVLGKRRIVRRGLS